VVASGTLYFGIYVGLSEYIKASSSTLHRSPGVLTKMWPTCADLLLLAYCWIELRQTINHIQESQQTRKLERYFWLSRLITLVFLALCLKQIASLGQLLTGSLIVELDQLSFFALLAGIGALWWPSPANRDYENVVEILPTQDELEREVPLFGDYNDSPKDDSLKLEITHEKLPTQSFD